MKNKILLGVMMLALIASSCAKAPETEMASAVAAMDSAKLVQADLYLEQEFKGLEDSLRVATEEVEVQKSKFFLTRNFDVAKNKFENIKVSADQLIAKTEVRKTELREEVLAELLEVKALLEENLALLNDAPKGKEGKEALEEIKGELTIVEAAISEVNALVEKGEIIAANDKITVAQDKAIGINTELKEAIAKYKGKTKKG